MDLKRYLKRYLGILLVITCIFSNRIPTWAEDNDPIAYTLSDEDTIIFTFSDQKEKKSYKINCKISYSYNPRARQFDYSVNLDCPDSIFNKPKLKLTLELNKSSSKNGTYVLASRRNFGEVGYLDNSGFSVDAATGHYKLYCYVSPVEPGIVVNTTQNYAYWCINRTGHIWVWNHKDYLSGKTMNEPYTSYEKKALYTRPSNLNTTYKKWYDGVYNTNLNLSGYDVHHIRPLAYGGDNTMGNLIHLEKTFHYSVTAWWNGY